MRELVVYDSYWTCGSRVFPGRPASARDVGHLVSYREACVGARPGHLSTGPDGSGSDR